MGEVWCLCLVYISRTNVECNDIDLERSQYLRYDAYALVFSDLRNVSIKVKW